MTYFIRRLKDQELLEKTERKVAEEKQVTLEVLQYLREIDRRRLYAARGFSSLFEFATGYLKYSSGAAQRRIDAMRVLAELPEVEEKVKEGSMNLDTLARTQSFFRQEEKAAVAIPMERKKEIIGTLEGKSTRECEKVLASLSSNPAAFLRPDRVRPVTQDHSEVRFVAPQALLDDLQKVRALLSNKNPRMSMAELIEELVRISLSKLDPGLKQGVRSKGKSKIAKKARETALKEEVLDLKFEALAVDDSSESRTEVDAVTAAATHTEPGPQAEPISFPAPETSLYFRSSIRRTTRREVFRRDGYCCTYQDSVTGRKCGSRFFLELDHIQPIALGGDSSVANLRVRCRGHNQWYALQIFGARKMEQHLGRG